MPTKASQFWFSRVRILSQPSQQGREGRERLFLEATSAKLPDVMQKAGLPLKQYKGNNSTACGAGTVLVTLNSSHTYNFIYTNVNTTLKQTKEKRRLGVSDLHKATELVRIPQSSLLKCMAGRAGMALRTVNLDAEPRSQVRGLGSGELAGGEGQWHRGAVFRRTEKPPMCSSQDKVARGGAPR